MMACPEAAFDVDLGARRAGGQRGWSIKAIAYDPPPVPPSLLPLANRLSVRRQPIQIPLGSRTLSFAPTGLGSPGPACPKPGHMAFRLALDGRPLVLHMAHHLYRRLLAVIDPDLLVADLDPDLLPLLLESCLEEALVAAEARLKRRLELTAIDAGADAGLAGSSLRLAIAVNGDAAGCAWLHGGMEEIRLVADAFGSREPNAQPFDDLAIPLSLRSGAIRLDLDTLKRLKPGDMLLCDDVARWNAMAAVVGERWLLPFRMTDDGPTLEAPLRRAGPQDREDWMMTDHDDKTLNDWLGAPTTSTPPPADDGKPSDPPAGEAAPPDEAACFDELPIKLVFELGRTEMPLGRLQTLGPGHVFALERPLGDAVRIHAGGRLIGAGEMVRIDDQVGVRITRLFGQDGA